MSVEIEVNTNKTHRERRAGKKAEKKKEKNKHVQDLTSQQRNPKAYAFHSIVKAQRNVARTQDIKSKKHHIPVVNRTPLEPPPVLVAVVGGQQAGKSTLIRSLIKNYTRQKITNIEGPITVVTGKKQRLNFVEVKNNINSMIDIAKIADVVLMMIDITMGFEMEVFEMLEICRSYGSPRIMGILNHLDLMKNNKGLNKRKKELTHRFQVELYPGAKLFYLTGLIHGEYLKAQISNLGRFISVLKFRPLQFRMTHPYVLVDRMEDITNMETIRQNPVCDRNVVLYGYVRGIPMQPKQYVHIPGVGDYRLKDISILDDPCPLPDKLKKRSLNSKERLLYAPMSGVAGVIYDKDAIYIDLGGSHHGRSNEQDGKNEEDDEGSKHNLLHDLLQRQDGSNAERIQEKGVRLFSYSKVIPNTEDCLEEEEEEEEDERSDNEEEESESERTEGATPKFEMQTDSRGNKRRKVIFEDELANDTIEDYEDSDYETEDISDEGELQSDDDSENEYMSAHKKLKKDSNLEEKMVNNTDNKRKDASNVMGLENLPGISQSHEVSIKSYILFLQNTIYGDAVKSSLEDDNGDDKSEDESDDGDFDLFRKARTNPIGQKSSKLLAGAELNGVDSFRLSAVLVRDWANEEVCESIRDCFVTGEWSEKESAEKLLKLDEEDEDLYGDFEDVETGVKFKAENKDSEGEDNNKGKDKEKQKADKTAQEKRLEKKRRLKEFFNSEYDDKGNEDYFDTLKAEMNEQAELNRTQFEGLDDETRVQYEGYRAGLYVRMELEGIPCELVNNFDSSYSLIVGGLLENELSMGYVKVRLKVHRWFPKILKNKDPLYLSLGWRRFQAMVFYAKKEDNFRLRSLKYARKYMHVEALFWGPAAEMNSGFIAIQDINVKTSSFSIAATGVVLETDQSTKLVKKLKLIGYPEKIYQKTAFIKDMFHSDTEVTKFEGVKIQTQSSIRGVIKKAHRQNGSFRATFEDIIKISDTVFLTSWAEIEIPKFCSIVRNLLLPLNDKFGWQGMKTNAQIKKEHNIRNLPNPDSLYTDITERREYIHLPLKIPKKLQALLPFKDKPKNRPARKKQQRVFVVKDPEEVKMKKFMDNLKMMMKDKKIRMSEEKKELRKARRKEVRMMEELKDARLRKKKAFVCKKRSMKKSKSS